MPTLALNKRAGYDYEFLETIEAGLVLSGGEVKSAKDGQAQLKGAFLFLHAGELYLKGCYIAPYKPAGSADGYDPSRDRKVLVHRRELTRLIGKIQEKGLTFVPISLYTKGPLVKLQFAVARGKRQFEKRETIKKREVKRELRERMRE